MKHSELRVGMKVKANKKSDEAYSITTQKECCVGVVVGIGAKSFDIAITDAKDVHDLGKVFKVHAECFDEVEGAEGEEIMDNKIKVQLKGYNISLDFEYGDVIVSESGKVALVVKGFDNGSSFKGVLLNTFKTTPVWASKEALIGNLETIPSFGGKAVRVIKGSNLKLSEI